jgi:hypothetical protein
MQVIQPYPAIENPSLFKESLKPLASRYLATTPDPGDNEVLINSGTYNPFANAFLANNPAAKMTPGLLVLVHEVIEAIKIEPCFKVYSFPLYFNNDVAFNLSYGIPYPLNPTGFAKH